MLETIILGFLLHSDMSGYDIKQFMELSTSNFYDASFGSIYPMLKKMEERGVIRTVEAVQGGKYRKVSSITEKGRELFMQWLEQPIEFRRTRQDHLVKLFFMGFLPREKARQLIVGFIERVEAEHRELEALKTKLGSHPTGFEASTLDYGIGYYRFTAEWCRQLLERMESEEMNDGQKDRCR